MRAHKSLVFALASIVALVAVRFAALGADPPPWLSWSSGIRTDEGFYALDARHLVVFGTWARGNFHDRLLSPLLSGVQQAVFQLFGPSLTTARALDAVLGLLTVAVLWLALRAAFDAPAAHAGALLLGFAPPFVLYNRLALQETPAAFCLTVSFALWALANGKEKKPPRPNSGEQEEESAGLVCQRAGQPLWSFPAPQNWGGGAALLLLCGVLAGAALLCKSLAVVCLPGLCWLAWKSGRQGWIVLGGLALILLPWAAFWDAPHHAEMARMAAYYQNHQFLPHTLRSLGLNIRRAGVGDSGGILRGLVPYLLVFVPIPCVLALGRLRGGWAVKSDAEQGLWLWLAGGALFCAISSYAPDRYDVLFLPPLCALAGLGWAALAPGRRWATALLAVAASAVWLGAAWHGRTWNAHRNAQTLAHLLPAHSVVAGDMAPALALGTHLDAAPVQPGLSNSVRPIETLGAQYLAITRAPAVTTWWQARYPQIVRPDHRIAALTVGPHTTVDVYQVDRNQVRP